MLIFLDIDGVLIPNRIYEKYAEPENIIKFNSACLNHLENVLRSYPNVRVVISSSWREIFPFEVIQPLFSPDIAIRIIGFTPFLNPKNIHQDKYLRHQEVLEYLRQNQAENSPWVAIDHIPEHYPPDAPVVAIDDYNGFDQNSAKILSEYLT
ncbi:HAD domain-containing protein [Microcoleus sp. Pol11C2]|uniref:HAD domain-containing protein n=1 Tax=Microcoleus sp. Pol11C2 TaxID=3055389 RepID=UPI002FD70F35